MRCDPRRALPRAGAVAWGCAARGWGPLCLPWRRAAPSLRPAASPLLCSPHPRPGCGRRAGSGDARGPAPAGAGWVLAPNSRGSWAWPRLAPGIAPGPGGVWGGSHPSSSLLGLGVGGGPPLARSLRGVDVPHPGTRRGIRLGEPQGPQTCSRSPGLAASTRTLGAPMLFGPSGRSVAFVPHRAAGVGAVQDPSCPEPPNHSHPGGGSFLILMRNTFSMC